MEPGPRGKEKVEIRKAQLPKLRYVRSHLTLLRNTRTLRKPARLANDTGEAVRVCFHARLCLQASVDGSKGHDRARRQWSAGLVGG